MIAQAPDDTGSSGGNDLHRLTTELQEENAELSADNEKLRAVVGIEKVKAELIAPYANKVFPFLVFYSICVFLVILLQGFKPKGFNLDTAVTAIISGSTAVAAIGLVGIVVRGLFGPPRRVDDEVPKRRRSKRS